MILRGGYLWMGKLNRGEVTKLSIRLTSLAREEIETFAKNLNLSKAGVILFVLTKILKEKPAKTTILNLEQKYDLEPQNLAITIKRELAEEISKLNESIDLNKNIWVGLLVSDYFETRQEGKLQDEQTDTEPFKIKIEANTELKKKIVNFSEERYIPLSGLVSYACLKGPYEGLPEYQSSEREYFFTRIPSYIYKEVKREADKRGIPDYFYMELCLYETFLGENRVFDL